MWLDAVFDDLIRTSELVKIIENRSGFEVANLNEVEKIFMKKKLKNFIDNRGLLFLSIKDNFKFKRIFFIAGKKNKSRGDHAHKKLTQILINIDSHSILKKNLEKRLKNLLLKILVNILFVQKIIGLKLILKKGGQ